MTRFGARDVANQFKLLGRFSDVTVSKHGEEWRVELWNVNSASGNRNLTVIDFLPKDEKAFKLAKKMALGKASERDQAAFGRMKAEREVNNS